MQGQPLSHANVVETPMLAGNMRHAMPVGRRLISTSTSLMRPGAVCGPTRH